MQACMLWWLAIVILLVIPAGEGPLRDWMEL